MAWCYFLTKLICLRWLVLVDSSQPDILGCEPDKTYDGKYLVGRMAQKKERLSALPFCINEHHAKADA